MNIVPRENKQCEEEEKEVKVVQQYNQISRLIWWASFSRASKLNGTMHEFFLFFKKKKISIDSLEKEI